jgi:Major Facilitator Superfamily.
MNENTPSQFSWTSIIVIVIGTFMAILNNSIVNVALPKIMLIFNCGQDSIQWVLTAYTMTLGVVMPISGYLGDTFGSKRIYSVALALFTLGSIISGLSWGLTAWWQPGSFRRLAEVLCSPWVWPLYIG